MPPFFSVVSATGSSVTMCMWPAATPVSNVCAVVAFSVLAGDRESMRVIARGLRLWQWIGACGHAGATAAARARRATVARRPGGAARASRPALLPPEPKVPPLFPKVPPKPPSKLLSSLLHAPPTTAPPISVNVSVRNSFLVMSSFEPMFVPSRCEPLFRTRVRASLCAPAPVTQLPSVPIRDAPSKETPYSANDESAPSSSLIACPSPRRRHASMPRSNTPRASPRSPSAISTLPA